MNPIPISKAILVVLISSAVLLRLPSICTRIAKALNNKGKRVYVFDCLDLTDCKEFEFAYKQGQLACDVVILANSCYVASAIKHKAQNCLWHTKSVRPHLSFLLEYSDELYTHWQQMGKIDPVAIANLPKRCFGTANHHHLVIKEDVDEIYACGRMVELILNTTKS